MSKKTFMIIKSEDKEDFEKRITEALNNGWQLCSFTVWSLSSNTEHWMYFQTLIK